MGERTRLAARYETGALDRELAVEFGINRTTVAKHLKAAGATLRCGAFTEAESDRSIELYATGLSTDAVSKQIVRDQSAVSRVLRDAGVVMRHRGGRQRGT